MNPELLKQLTDRGERKRLIMRVSHGLTDIGTYSMYKYMYTHSLSPPSAAKEKSKLQHSVKNKFDSFNTNMGLRLKRQFVVFGQSNGSVECTAGEASIQEREEKRASALTILMQLVRERNIHHQAVLSIAEKVVAPQELEEIITQEKPWDRCRKLLETNEGSLVHPLSRRYATYFMVMTSLGACLGGSVESKIAAKRFIERNKITPFMHFGEAKRMRNDAVMLHGASGFFKWALRCIVIGVPMFATIAALQTYLNKDSILFYIAGGGIGVGLFRLPHGPRGLVVGSLVGSVFGCALGISHVPLMRYGGEDVAALNRKIWLLNLFEKKLYKKEVSADLIEDFGREIGIIEP